jgi:hypothetical protein
VPRRAQSNYAQTYLSLASSLNLSYLDPVVATMADSTDRRVLAHLIQKNALMSLARRAGYRVVAIGSDYGATERMDNADLCHCTQFGLHEIEATALNLTPLRALPITRWTYGAHRRKIESSFGRLREMRRPPGGEPTLVFAHLVAPHPPFVFGPGGVPIEDRARLFAFHDGKEHFGSDDEYATGYRNQADYIATQALTAVDAILSSPGPSPVIVIQGDHGPGSISQWESLRGERGRDRLAILAAYRLPGSDPDAIPDHITPVNGLRLVANRYLGTDLPALPDTSYASTWDQPYRFEVIGSEVQSALNHR